MNIAEIQTIVGLKRVPWDADLNVANTIVYRFSVTDPQSRYLETPNDLRRIVRQDWCESNPLCTTIWCSSDELQALQDFFKQHGCYVTEVTQFTVPEATYVTHPYCREMQGALMHLLTSNENKSILRCSYSLLTLADEKRPELSLTDRLPMVRLADAYGAFQNVATIVVNGVDHNPTEFTVDAPLRMKVLDTAYVVAFDVTQPITFTAIFYSQSYLHSLRQY